MKCTITINDTPPNGKCCLEIHFDPPLATPPQKTEATKLALFILDAVKKQAVSFNQITHLATTKSPHKN